jgi:alpha-galactosidase
MDTRSGGVGVVLGDRILAAADIVVMSSREESVFATARRFCGLLCEKPRLARQPVYGINDWYYAYGNNNPELILRQTGLMTALATDTANRPFSVVDAGWAFYSPLHPGDGGWMDDFSRPNDKFKDMRKLADGIIKEGMRPGLWTRPLCASYKDPANLLLPAIPGRDDPKSPILDPSIEENLERVRRNISIYRQWGYEMVKHDYSTYDIFGKWGFEMGGDVTTPGWRFRDNTRTTAEIVLGLYRVIREAAGDMYVIGCNTLSHLSAGLFELNRVGDDTSGKEWARTRKMGVNTLGFRMIQHNRLYAADGDCVGLTKDIPWEKNKQWMQLVAGTGSPLFISAEPEMLGAEQKAMIRASFSQAARPLPAGEPLDWLTNPLPSRWKLDGSVLDFDWG